MKIPLVKRQAAILLADELQSMSADELRETMKKMFDKFEKLTGLKPMVAGNRMPTKVLFPKENVKSSNNGKTY